MIVNGTRYGSRDRALRSLGIGMTTLNKLLLEEGNGFVDSTRQQKHIEFMKELEKQKEVSHRIHMERMYIANQRPERKEKISRSLKGRKHDW